MREGIRNDFELAVVVVHVSVGLAEKGTNAWACIILIKGFVHKGLPDPVSSRNDVDVAFRHEIPVPAHHSLLEMLGKLRASVFYQKEGDMICQLNQIQF